MKGAHVLEKAVFTDGRLRLLDEFAFRAGVQRMKLGDGEEVLIYVARADEAVRHYQYKHLFGHVFRPVADVSGHTERELYVMAKALFMPEGKTSLTELTFEEMDIFTKESEQWLREEMPEAFVLQDAQRGAA